MKNYIIEGWLYDTDKHKYLVKRQIKFDNLSDKEQIMGKILKQIKRRLWLRNTHNLRVFRHDWGTYLDDNICVTDNRFHALIYEKRVNNN